MKPFLQEKDHLIVTVSFGPAKGRVTILLIHRNHKINLLFIISNRVLTEEVKNKKLHTVHTVHST